MALRYGRLRQISMFPPHVYSGNHYRRSRRAIDTLSSSFSILLPHCRECEPIGRNGVSFCFSNLSQARNEESPPQVDILTFIESTFDQLQGPHHCWINVDERNRDFFERDRALLVLAGHFLDNSSCQKDGCDPFVMVERVKLIQQRFPQLRIMGYLPSCSLGSSSYQTHVVEIVMKEYITFPILLSDKSFSEMENEACYIVFKGFRNARVYHEKDMDIQMLNKVAEELTMQQNGNSTSPANLKSTWVKQAVVHKEPQICSFVRNLCLHFPGCISADESGNRLFLSDSNHHRIIIVDGNGKILDSIGSCPGFEDGEFESAKLVRPAATYYHEDGDCLYIVDSENHAIRRADMGRRVVETLYPTCGINRKNNSLWTWIVNKLGLGTDDDAKSEEFGPNALMFPWHLMMSEDNSFLIINRSFETLWNMDLASGQIKDVVRGFSRILEIYGQLIMVKASLLKQIPDDWLQQQISSSCSSKGLPYADLISSLTAFQNHIIMCDTVGQRIVKLSREAGVCSNLQLSKFGILGLPYWLAYPLERVYAVAHGFHETWTDHIQHFSLLPGRIDIQVKVDVPLDTELVEPLEGGSIWLQARGAATEVSGAENVAESSEKVGVSQQWYDELDNLAFSTPESELIFEDDNATTDLISHDERIYINCTVNASPGTSEVSIYTAPYLKLRRYPDQQESQEKCAARIADILNLGRSGGIGRDSCIQLLLKSNGDLRDLIFMKPLHVRIKLACLDHPKADNSKDIILTNSNIEVNVSLNT